MHVSGGQVMSIATSPTDPLGNGLPLLRLPSDVVAHIASCLLPPDLRRLAATCTATRSLLVPATMPAALLRTMTFAFPVLNSSQLSATGRASLAKSAAAARACLPLEGAVGLSGTAWSAGVLLAVAALDEAVTVRNPGPDEWVPRPLDCPRLSACASRMRALAETAQPPQTEATVMGSDARSTLNLHDHLDAAAVERMSAADAHLCDALRVLDDAVTRNACGIARIVEEDGAVRQAVDWLRGWAAAHSRECDPLSHAPAAAHEPSLNRSSCAAQVRSARRRAAHQAVLVLDGGERNSRGHLHVAAGVADAQGGGAGGAAAQVGGAHFGAGLDRLLAGLALAAELLLAKFRARAASETDAATVLARRRVDGAATRCLGRTRMRLIHSFDVFDAAEHALPGGPIEAAIEAAAGTEGAVPASSAHFPMPNQRVGDCPFEFLRVASGIDSWPSAPPHISALERARRAPQEVETALSPQAYPAVATDTGDCSHSGSACKGGSSCSSVGSVADESVRGDSTPGLRSGRNTSHKLASASLAATESSPASSLNSYPSPFAFEEFDQPPRSASTASPIAERQVEYSTSDNVGIFWPLRNVKVPGSGSAVRSNSATVTWAPLSLPPLLPSPPLPMLRSRITFAAVIEDMVVAQTQCGLVAAFPLAAPHVMGFGLPSLAIKRLVQAGSGSSGEDESSAGERIFSGERRYACMASGCKLSASTLRHSDLLVGNDLHGRRRTLLPPHTLLNAGAQVVHSTYVSRGSGVPGAVPSIITCSSRFSASGARGSELEVHAVSLAAVRGGGAAVAAASRRVLERECIMHPGFIELNSANAMALSFGKCGGVGPAVAKVGGGGGKEPPLPGVGATRRLGHAGEPRYKVFALNGDFQELVSLSAEGVIDVKLSFGFLLITYAGSAAVALAASSATTLAPLPEACQALADASVAPAHAACLRAASASLAALSAAIASNDARAVANATAELSNGAGRASFIVVRVLPLRACALARTIATPVIGPPATIQMLELFCGRLMLKQLGQPLRLVCPVSGATTLRWEADFPTPCAQVFLYAARRMLAVHADALELRDASAGMVARVKGERAASVQAALQGCAQTGGNVQVLMREAAVLMIGAPPAGGVFRLDIAAAESHGRVPAADELPVDATADTKAFSMLEIADANEDGNAVHDAIADKHPRGGTASVPVLEPVISSRQVIDRGAAVDAAALPPAEVEIDAEGQPLLDAYLRCATTVRFDEATGVMVTGDSAGRVHVWQEE